MVTKEGFSKGFEAYLKFMVDREASDLYFSVGAPVNVRIEGVTAALDEPVITTKLLNELIECILSSEQVHEYREKMEMNLSFALEDLGRFRVNVYRQRGEPAMVIRYIKTRIPSIEQLNLPPILKELIMAPRGLILVVGATGSGKSTTLASMIDHRNSNKTGHILTVEEPIEFVHGHKRSIVDQREVGLDTLSYGNALKNAMREAPDVILIGEIRDEETMRHAITYSETGHLCLSTLHANNANQTLDRIVNFFPEGAHHQLLQDLGANLKAVISQRLVMGVDGKRLPVVEIMLNSLHVADLIAKGEFEGIKQAMEHSEFSGMCTFDQCLFDLFQNGQISEDVALGNADSRNNVHVNIQLAKGKRDDEDIKHLFLHGEDAHDELEHNKDASGGVTYPQRKAGEK
ncbi:PilT/PilU family type 4a pilus ATPase [Pseudomonadota bacterium]